MDIIIKHHAAHRERKYTLKKIAFARRKEKCDLTFPVLNFTLLLLSSGHCCHTRDRDHGGCSVSNRYDNWVDVNNLETLDVFLTAAIKS